MKKIGDSSKLLVLILVLGFSACKKDDPAVPAPAAAAAVTNGSMTAKLNGANWTSILNTGVHMIDQGGGMSALVLNGSTTTDIFALGIDFPTTFITTGSNDIMDNAVFTYATKTSGGGTMSQHLTDTGNITITSVDNTNKKVSGIFDFVIYKVGGTGIPQDTIKITNGVFTDIKYTTQDI